MNKSRGALNISKENINFTSGYNTWKEEYQERPKHISYKPV